MKRINCDLCRLSGENNPATHEIFIEPNSEAFQLPATETVACLCDSCYTEIEHSKRTMGEDLFKKKEIPY